MPLSLISSVVPRFLSRRRALKEPSAQLVVKFSPSEALLHYSTPGIAPPSARIDPKLKLAARRPPRIWEYWKFAAVAASKATHVTSEVLSHTIWGPRRKSWGIEMTLVTSLIREMERHADLVNIDALRTVISLGGLVPLPSDALVTPVTFQVTKRNLRGILAEWDATETGHRELHGEWVVGKKTWLRLQQEWKNANRAEGDLPRTAPKGKERVILYIHGGAYYLSSAAAQRIISIPLAKYADARVFALDYRLAPESCFPGPLHDVVSGYLRLVEDLSIPPENIILAGDSAGGGLCLALMLYLRDNSYPLPAAAILMSPWCDLTLSCESWDLNAAYDVVPFPPDNHMNPIAMYLGENMEEYLTHPYASPLFGDMAGLPPMLIQAGDAEVLRDEIGLVAQKAALAGVEVKHEVYEDAVHVFQTYPFLDCAKQAFVSIHNYVKRTLPQIQSRSPQVLPSIAEVGLGQEIRDNPVIVSGDGTEMPSGEEQLQTFEAPRSKSETSSDTDTEKEPTSSWTHSPAWHGQNSLHFVKGGNWKDGENLKVQMENASESSLDHIPDLSLSPSSPPEHKVNKSPSKYHSLYRPLSHPSTRESPARRLSKAKSQNLLRSSVWGMTSLNCASHSGIRNAARSNSHPDLTLLVESWPCTGPANKTLPFRA